MVNEFKIPFAIEQEFLLFSFLFSFLLKLPLVFQHFTLLFNSLRLLSPLDFTSLSLPIKNGHCILNFFLFLTCFLHLAFKLPLSIKLPELGIYLLFHHFSLHIPSFVNQLFLPLNSRSIIVELLVLFPQGIVGGFESHILPASNLFFFLRLTLSFQMLETLPHFISNLLWCLKVVVKLLLINAVFSCKQGSQACLALLQILFLLHSHLLYSSLDKILLNKFICLRFPKCLVCQVLVTLDIS